jgi:hypothetical protein
VAVPLVWSDRILSWTSTLLQGICTEATATRNTSIWTNLDVRVHTPLWGLST